MCTLSLCNVSAEATFKRHVGHCRAECLSSIMTLVVRVISRNLKLWGYRQMFGGEGE